MGYGSSYGDADDGDYRSDEPAGGHRARGAGRRSVAKGGPQQRPLRARRQHFRWIPGHSWLAKFGYAFVAISAALAVGVGVTGYVIYWRLNSNIQVVKVGGLSGRTVYGAQNILVLGSQERQGQHGHFGQEQDPWTTNSDNLLVVHLDPTHTHATILSIPRDTMVYQPGCKARIPQIGIGIQGPYTFPPGSIIDGALNIGGPTCAVETVEDLTGIKLDHFVEFDFNSFRTMVDEFGGVEVCVPKGGYHDQASNVNLTAGRHLLKYNQALAYVRTRHNLGGPDAGGDLPRIELQQAFISSVVQKVETEGLLSNIPDLLSIARTASRAVTVDPSLASVTSLVTLAKSLVHLKSKNVSMLTMPTLPDPDPGFTTHLVAEEPQDDVLFQMLRTGQIWHGHLPLQPAAKVQVRVLNATGQTGLAKRTATSLRKLGFDVISIGDAADTSTTTVSYAGLTQADSAYTLMSALKSFPAGENTLAEPADQEGTNGPVTLVLGANFTGVNPPAAVTPAKPAKHGKHAKTGTGTGGTAQPASDVSATGPGAVQSRNGAANICSGLPPPTN
jgi:LCP family protein required for cell wall assembly